MMIFYNNIIPSNLLVDIPLSINNFSSHCLICLFISVLTHGFPLYLYSYNLLIVTKTTVAACFSFFFFPPYTPYSKPLLRPGRSSFKSRLESVDIFHFYYYQDVQAIFIFLIYLVTFLTGLLAQPSLPL